MTDCYDLADKQAGQWTEITGAVTVLGGVTNVVFGIIAGVSYAATVLRAQSIRGLCMRHSVILS